MAQLTVIEYIARVGKRVSPDSPLTSEQSESIEKALPAALQRLGQSVADSPNPATRALLQQDFVLTLSAGEVVLPDDMVETSVPLAVLTLTGYPEPLQHLPYFQDVLSPPSMADYGFFTLSHGKIVVRDYTGTAPSATDLTVYNANFIPTIDEVPGTLIDDLLDIGVVLYGESAAAQSGAQVAA